MQHKRERKDNMSDEILVEEQSQEINEEQYNGPPESRTEEILQSMIDGEPYAKKAESRIEARLIELKEVIGTDVIERADTAARAAEQAAEDANEAISAIYHDKNFLLSVNADKSLTLSYDPEGIKSEEE